MRTALQILLAEYVEKFPNMDIIAPFGDDLKIKISPLKYCQDNELPLLYHAICIQFYFLLDEFSTYSYS